MTLAIRPVTLAIWPMTLDLCPELLVRNPFALSDLSPGDVEEGLELRRVRKHQALHVFVRRERKKDGNCLPLSRDDDGTPLTRLEVRAELRFNLSHRSYSHSLTSSLPIRSRLPRLIPIATT